MNARAPLVVRIDPRDAASVDRALGHARAAASSGSASVMIFDITRDALDAHFSATFERWLERNLALVGHRLEAIVIVLPSFWSALLWRLGSRGAPAPVALGIARSVEEALAWAAPRSSGHVRLRRGPVR